MKRLLFYSTRSSIAPVFIQLFEALSRNFALTARARILLSGTIRQAKPFLPGNHAVVQMLLPLWYLAGFFIILLRTLFDRPDVLLLDTWPEQLILSPFAKMFKWRVIWLALPGAAKVPGWLEGAYVFAGHGAEIIVSSNDAKLAWEKRVKAAKLHIILPAGAVPLEQQSDLFKALAGRGRHRFVIGSVIENLDKKLVERLLGSLTVGLSVCSALELVIVGEGENRKQLQWLIRKLGLSGNVWLPGSGKAARWLEHINVYVLPQENPDLTEISDAILAMRYGVPVLGPAGANLSDVVTPKTGALIEITDAEIVARQFLRLEQDPELRRQLGHEARQHADTLTFERLLADMSNVLAFSL